MLTGIAGALASLTINSKQQKVSFLGFYGLKPPIKWQKGVKV